MFSPQPPPSPSPSPSVSVSADGGTMAAGGGRAPAAAAGGGGGRMPAGSPTTVAGGPRPPKRVRLSLACNQCRKRKVRCDASEPRCHNCVTRNEPCETTNLRNSGPAVRHWPAKDGQCLPAAVAAAAAASPLDQAPTPASQGRPPPPPPSAPSSESPSSESREARHGRTSSLSWLSRAYRAQEAEGGGGGNQHGSSPPELVVNTDADRGKVKFMGGSSLQCICRFVDLHLHHWGLEPVGSLFRHGMRRSEEFALPLQLELPDLPAAPEMDLYIDAFFSRIHPLFPVVDRSAFTLEVQQERERQERQPGTLRDGATTTQRVPFLAMAYAVASLGADELSGVATDTSTRYLTAAYGLYAHLVATPYLDSVRALLLLTLALRSQIRDGQAWQVLGQAVRMAHSIGLHRHLSDLPESSAQAGPAGAAHSRRPGADALRRRTWWACYALEKLMQLESGRPSIIHGPEDDQMLAQSLGRVTQAQDGFAAWVALSRILGRISQHIYEIRAPSAWHLLNETATLDQALTNWEQSLPDALQIQPSQFGVRAGGREGSTLVAAFLAQQFYHAQIALFRASLVFPPHSWADEVAKHRGSLPNAARLEASAAACLTAARETLTRGLQLADQNTRAGGVLLGPTPPFLAAIVLALAILQRPARRLARAELELLREGARLVEDLYRAWRFDDAFVAGCAALRDRVAAVVQLAAHGPLAAKETTAAAAAQATPPTGTGTGAARPAVAEAAVGTADHTLPSPLETADATAAQSENYAVQSSLIDPFLSSFDGADFEELWSMVGPDFAWDSGSTVAF